MAPSLGKRLDLPGGWALPVLLGVLAAAGAGRGAEAGRRPIRYTITGRAPFERLGASFDVLGDMDGDGVPELGVAEPGGEQHERLPGKLHIFRARDGALIRTLTDGVVANYFGASFAQISDLDGDGVRELAVGATNATVRGLKGAGAVHALRLADGRIFWSIPGLNGNRTPLGEGYLGDVFGGCVEPLGDLDSDGFEDVATLRGGRVAYSEGDWRRMVVASGRRGTPLGVLEAEQDHIGFASSIRRLGDVDRDGRPEFAAAAPRYDSAASGNGSRS